MKKIVLASALFLLGVCPVSVQGQILKMTLNKDLGLDFSIDSTDYSLFVETQFFSFDEGDFARDILLFKASSGPMSGSIYRLPLGCLGEGDMVSSTIESFDVQDTQVVIYSRIKNVPYKTFYLIRKQIIVLDDCHPDTTPPK